MTIDALFLFFILTVLIEILVALDKIHLSQTPIRPDLIQKSYSMFLMPSFDDTCPELIPPLPQEGSIASLLRSIRLGIGRV